MRRIAFLLVPLFLFACDRQPAAPDIAPELGATHETVPTTISGMDWYTAMPCLGYDSWEPPDAVHWTAGWVTITDMYLYLPHDQLPHDRYTIQWSDDLQFETPDGDVWKPVPNIYNFNGWVTLYDPVNWVPASANVHEQLVFERADGARMKITNSNHISVNAAGDMTAFKSVWSCNLTRPGK